jgi:nucleoside-diphosphate-sugar epimerase
MRSMRSTVVVGGAGLLDSRLVEVLIEGRTETPVLDRASPKLFDARADRASVHRNQGAAQ